MKFTKDQHRLWAELMKRQIPNVERFACQEYLQGFKNIDLPKDQIPTLAMLNSKITPKTGWKAVRTNIRYLDSWPWYEHFLIKEFTVTTFLRGWAEIEFTHEPDMFHDVFGHLPFHTVPEYTDLVEMFAPVFLRANKEQQDNIKRLAWFSTEFGLIKENGVPKIFGTGLMSSIGEISQVTSGKTRILPFTIESVLKRNKAIYTFNKELFIFESIESLKKELERYFDTIENKSEVQIVSNSIVDRQMTGIK